MNIPRFVRSLVAVVRDLVPGLVVAGSLVVLAVLAPGRAALLVREDHVVEWLQVVLALTAVGFVLAAATRRLSAADVILSVLLLALAVFEVDLDRRLFGTPIVDVRFFRLEMVPWPVHALAAAVIAGAPLTLFVYAAQRWRELWEETREGIRHGWAPLLVAGLVLFGVAYVWERQLNRFDSLPRYFLEETFELVGAAYVALAMHRRARRRSRHEGARRVRRPRAGS